MIVHVETEDEWRTHIGKSKSFGGKAVLVDFFAEWCAPCKAVAPFFEKLSTQFPSVTFLKVDVDKLQDVAAECGVTAMPTFQAYFNGDKVDEFKGADQGKLAAMADTLSKKSASLGTGQKLGSADGGGSAAAADDGSMDARRARMAAAAEARFKAMGQ